MSELSVQERAMGLLEQLGREHAKYEELVGEAGLESYKSEADDVIVASFMKSGTTMMQQMVYQLMCASGRVESDTDGEKFSDINDVVPFIESMHRTGQVEPCHTYSPRCYQTHMEATTGRFSASGNRKYIYCVRDGRRVAASMFDFILDWMVPAARDEPEEVRNEAYRMWMRVFFLETRGWFQHVRSWLDFAKSPDANVLFVTYEETCADVEGAVRKVGKFLGLDVTDEVAAKVVRRCSREYMVGDERFDDRSISEIMGWDVKLGNRVRPADAKSFKNVQLDDDDVKQYEELYAECFEGDVKDYTELKNALVALSS